MDENVEVKGFKCDEHLKSILINSGYKLIKEGAKYRNFKIVALSIIPYHSKGRDVDAVNVIYYFDVITDDGSTNERCMIGNLNIETGKMKLITLLKKKDGKLIMLDTDDNEVDWWNKNDTGSSN